MGKMEKEEEILNRIKQLKEEINKLEQEIQQAKKDSNKYVFNELKKITHDQINTVFFVGNGDIKYLTQNPDSGFGVLLIINNKGYLLDLEYYKLIEKNLEIGYFEKYDIPDGVVHMIRKTNESNIDYANPLIFKLYHLLRKYPVNFVRINYFY